MINKDGRISPVIALSILLLFNIGLTIAVLVGMLYLFEAQNVEIKREQQVLKEDETSESKQTEKIIENQNKQIGLLTLQTERGNSFRNQTFTFQEGMLKQINDTVTKEFARNANLTAEDAKLIVDQIRLVFNTTLPELNESILKHTTQLENITDQMMERQKLIANSTLQKDNNEKITEVLRLLNSSVELVR